MRSLTAGGRYPPCADDDVTLVQHRRLTRCDPVRRFVEKHAEAARCGRDGARNGRRAVPQLDVGPLDVDVELALGAAALARERLTRADDDLIAPRLRLEAVGRSARGLPESLAPPRCEAPGDAVRADDVAQLDHALATA